MTDKQMFGVLKETVAGTRTTSALIPYEVIMLSD